MLEHVGIEVAVDPAHGDGRRIAASKQRERLLERDHAAAPAAADELRTIEIDRHLCARGESGEEVLAKAWIDARPAIARERDDGREARLGLPGAALRGEPRECGLRERGAAESDETINAQDVIADGAQPRRRDPISGFIDHVRLARRELLRTGAHRDLQRRQAPRGARAGTDEDRIGVGGLTRIHEASDCVWRLRQVSTAEPSCIIDTSQGDEAQEPDHGRVRGGIRCLPLR
ncbi:hypothetical protein ACMHYB_54345 [Sorangium sp. So ce1128]